MLFDHDLCGAVQVAGAPVVAESLPRLQHVVDGGGAERLDRREAIEEPRVVGRDDLDSGLL